MLLSKRRGQLKQAVQVRAAGDGWQAWEQAEGPLGWSAPRSQHGARSREVGSRRRRVQAALAGCVVERRLRLCAHLCSRLLQGMVRQVMHSACRPPSINQPVCTHLARFNACRAWCAR